MNNDGNSAKLSAFRDIVRRWDGGEDCFDQAVGQGVRLLPDGLRVLARKCRTAPGTISRWMNGHSRPPSQAQKQIVEFLRRKLLTPPK